MGNNVSFDQPTWPYHDIEMAAAATPCLSFKSEGVFYCLSRGFSPQ